MKAVATVTVAVLVVIGIGVAVVGGLTYPLPPARTYVMDGTRFTVAFPGPLRPTAVRTEVGHLVVDAGTADGGHLEMIIWVFKDPVVLRIAGEARPVCSASIPAAGLPLPLKPGQYCSVGFVWKRTDVAVIGAIISTEGLSPATTVAGSVKVATAEPGGPGSTTNT